MGMGVQGEACGEVTQHAGHRLGIHTILEGNGREGVSEVVESYFRDTRSLKNLLEHIIRTVRGNRTTVLHTKVPGFIEGIRLVVLLAHEMSGVEL